MDSNSNKDTDIAWAAGFFEGEGHVKCAKRHNVKRTDRYFSITVAQVHREPLDKLQHIFGGKVYGPYGPYATNKQPYFNYTAYGKEALDAVSEMMPYLYRKGEQCKVAVQEWDEYLASK